jgi:hypothetical protein
MEVTSEYKTNNQLLDHIVSEGKKPGQELNALKELENNYLFNPLNHLNFRLYEAATEIFNAYNFNTDSIYKRISSFIYQPHAEMKEARLKYKNEITDKYNQIMVYPCGIQVLPVEIKSIIIEYLPTKAHAALTQMDHSWKEIVEGSSQFKELIKAKEQKIEIKKQEFEKQMLISKVKVRNKNALGLLSYAQWEGINIISFFPDRVNLSDNCGYYSLPLYDENRYNRGKRVFFLNSNYDENTSGCYTFNINLLIDRSCQMNPEGIVVHQRKALSKSESNAIKLQFQKYISNDFAMADKEDFEII